MKKSAMDVISLSLMFLSGWNVGIIMHTCLWGEGGYGSAIICNKTFYTSGYNMNGFNAENTRVYTIDKI